jgi:Pyridine nucleotide-disulphide oxidoreductase
MILSVLKRRFPQLDGKPAFSLEGLPRVVIIGAGFGGIACARALRHTAVQVTLIDRHNYHLFQPLLYQVATAALSPGDIAVPIRSMFRDQFNTRVLLGNVTDIDARRQQVILQDLTVPFDYLVVATGATHSYFGKDAWARFAPGLKGVDDATAIRRRVLEAFERAEIAKSEAERQHRNLTRRPVSDGWDHHARKRAATNFNPFLCRSASEAVARRGSREGLSGNGKPRVCVEVLVRTYCPGFHPGLDERARFLLRAGGGTPAIPGRPGLADSPSGRRSTGGWWSRPTSAWRGRSPAGWQFTQRGLVSGNVGGSRQPGNKSLETGLAGWGTWIRTRINGVRVASPGPVISADSPD